VKHSGVRALVATALIAALIGLALPDADDLVQNLGAERSMVRDEAAAALRAMGPNAIPALRRGALDPTPAIRARASALLELTTATEPRTERPADAPEQLARRALAIAEHRMVPSQLVQSLGEHPSPTTVAALTQLLREERLLPSAGVAAARAMEGHAALPPLAPHLAVLDEALDTVDGPLRRAVVALVGVLAAEDLAPLSRRAGDVHPGVRVEIARALGRRGREGSRVVLTRLARDADAHVRTAALEALAALPGCPHPGPAMIAAHDDAPQVRAAAAALLGSDALPSSLPALKLLAEDPELRVRAAAARALDRLAPDRLALNRSAPDRPALDRRD